MNMKHLSILLTSMLTLSACCPHQPPSCADAINRLCSDANAKGEELSLGKYKEPITMKIAFSLPNEPSKLAQGDTYEDNPWSRYFEGKTNIKVLHSWQAMGEGNAYRQKVDEAIAANDLPDAFTVNRQQLRTLVEKDMLVDLSEAYSKYASPLVKEMYDSTHGVAMKDVTFRGKLMALPNIEVEADSVLLTWIRQDWLDKLQLSSPQTLIDLEKIAKAFIEQDPDGNGKQDTIGMPGDHSFTPVFAAYHSFPKSWRRDRNGQMQYGSIAPETKEALAKLAAWYKEGIIDSDFGLRKEPNELIIANKAGILIGSWLAPYGPLKASIKSDTTAEWRAYTTPLDNEGKFVSQMDPITNRYLVVKKGYPYPEAAIRLLNQFTQYERVDSYLTTTGNDQNTTLQLLKSYRETNNVQPRYLYPFDLPLDYVDSAGRAYKAVKNVLEGKILAEKLPPPYLSLYKNVLLDQENPKKNLDAWASAQARQHGASVIVQASIERIYSEFSDSAATIDPRWTHLESMEHDAFLNIIRGNAPLDSFDHFVQQWKEQGGETITQEIQKRVERKFMK
ncbi:extracellular solute-binding protein [Paenibacillus sp. LMG 31461]|uniref:Extracellular solute-binding protein n=1 Tax=Paenibacillus plantarum TaxID=2654975 RepID=A0ABX1X7G1_9BACL|nr:extracellular solute-binding protein [Paenibacillus plantarum]NOU63979.1 extracellular solute-binding protein [Paenibacillus plantarum]